MDKPTPDFHLLASRLMQYETAGHHDAADLADAGQRICQRLHRGLAPVLGSEGFRVIMARALHLTKAKVPFLEPVEFESHSDACLRGLHESAQGLDAGEVGTGLATLLSSFIEVLASLVGEDLARRNLASIWPDASFGDVGEGPQEVESE